MTRRVCGSQICENDTRFPHATQSSSLLLIEFVATNPLLKNTVKPPMVPEATHAAPTTTQEGTTDSKVCTHKTTHTLCRRVCFVYHLTDLLGSHIT